MPSPISANGPATQERRAGPSGASTGRREAIWLLLAPLAMAGLLIKLLIIGKMISPGDFPATRAPLLSTVAILALTMIPLCWLRSRHCLWAALSINLGATALALADLWHFRFYGEPWSLAEVPGLSQFPRVMSSVLFIVRPIDALAVLDIVLIAVLGGVAASTHRGGQRATPRRLAAVPALLGIVAAIQPAWLIARDSDEVFEYEYQRQDVVAGIGIAGYHLYDLTTHLIYTVRGRLSVSERDVAAAEEALAARQADQLLSRLSGLARGRNLIMLSAESLHAFPLDMRVNGQPLAPHLAAFARESLQFTRFYDQTHMGTTADAQFMAMNSLLPLSAGAVATRYDSNDFRALPQVLAERGYATLSACAEPASVWNMRHMHARLGFARSLFAPQFPDVQWIGAGKDDAGFFEQLPATLHALPEPFFAFMLSSTNHHPYRLPAGLQRLDPAPLPDTMAGDYLQSVRYFDDAFGKFIQTLTHDGLLDRSVVVVYGDHQSWMENAELERLWNAAGNSGTPTSLELWAFRRTLPLLIRLPGGAEAGRRDPVGGHPDITPTILSLIGIHDAKGPWLGRDLTAPGPGLVAFRDGSVTDGRTIALAAGTREWTCFADGDQSVPCEWLEGMRAEGRRLFQVSDQIIRGNLSKVLTTRLEHRHALQPRAPGRVWIVAHRGNSIEYPENTLMAIRSAFDLGADAVEVDIRLSRDGVPIVFHDDTLDRTTNGRGPAAALTVNELKRLDAGAWMDARFTGARVPTLEEALREARGRGRLLLDLKIGGLAAAVARTYSRVGVPFEDALIAAWTPQHRAEFLRDMPGARVLKIDAAPLVYERDFFRRIRDEGVWGIELGDDWPAGFVGDAARHGMPVFAYTVNDEETMRRLIEMGISGIETDDPARLLTIASRLGAR